MFVQSSQGFLRATATTVSMVHHTAIEYLFDENRKDDLPVLSRGDADLTLSWECFRYLHYAFGDSGRFPRGGVKRCHDWPRDSGSGRNQQEEEQHRLPVEVARKDPQEAAARQKFLRYAAESWFIHAQRSVEISEDKFCDDSTHNWLEQQFFETSDIVRNPWIELCGDSRMGVLAGEQTPLHIAVCLGLTPLVEKALSNFQHGANSKQSPLHLAARFISGTYKILIAKCGPSFLTDPDQDGNTPLHEAAISGHSSMLNALVKNFSEHKAYSNEINKKNHSGNTPLHLAFQFDHTEIVELLIQKGADTTIKNNAQMTAPELGEKLKREDSLDVVKHAEKLREEVVKEVVEEPVEELLGEPIEGLQQSAGARLQGGRLGRPEELYFMPPSSWEGELRSPPQIKIEVRLATPPPSPREPGLSSPQPERQVPVLLKPPIRQLSPLESLRANLQRGLQRGLSGLSRKPRKARRTRA